MSKKFLPDDFVIPTGLQTDQILLRKLTTEDLEKDYEAVMSSVEHLKGFFGPKSPWPSADMTLEEDLQDLKWHQEEFEKRSSFAYTVMNLDETRCLGCVYLFPSRKKSFEVDVFLWVRQSELATGLDEKLFAAVQKWIAKEWPFRKVAYPGREISWMDWESVS